MTDHLNHPIDQGELQLIEMLSSVRGLATFLQNEHNATTDADDLVQAVERLRAVLRSTVCGLDALAVDLERFGRATAPAPSEP